jgi:IMP dehydrogenase
MTALAFDDVLLVPQYSEISSRSNVSLCTQLAHNILLELPVISAPMDSVTEVAMAEAMAQEGGLGIIHRYMTLAHRLNHVRTAYPLAAGLSVGTKEDVDAIARGVIGGEIGLVCVDVAHGHHVDVGRFIEKLRGALPNTHIMAGNVATAEGFRFLQDAGADSIRVGIGGGSVCTTRIVTGHGIPTFQSVWSIDEQVEDRTAKIIADGGIRTTGDMVKALAAGADAVMVGNMLAGTIEAPDISYRGMASAEAQGGTSDYVEGVATQRKRSNISVRTILGEIRAGLQSGLSYSGARNLAELREKALFQQITQAGILESRPHALETE